MEQVWLKEYLKGIKTDIAELKKKVDALQRSKWMFDGVKVAAQTLMTIGITLLTMYLRGHN